MTTTRPPTEQELLKQYADLIELLAIKGPDAVESVILAMGRTEMHHLMAFLLVRCLDLDMNRFKTLADVKVKLEEDEDTGPFRTPEDL